MINKCIIKWNYSDVCFRVDILKTGPVSAYSGLLNFDLHVIDPNIALFFCLLYIQKDNGFEQAIADYRTNKHILCDKYDEVNKYYMKLPGQHKDDLDRFFKGISETVTQRKQELTSSGCTILIAGRWSAL